MSEEIIKILMNIERELAEVKTTGLSTLAQATKTNGRVHCLEESNSKLSNIVSRHNGILLKWEENEENVKKDYRLLTRKLVWIVAGAFLIYVFRDLPAITGFITHLL
jgi:ribosome-binding ATPase YchF (GTP1/OBG family)